MDLPALKEKLAQYEQEHLLQFWDSLNEQEQVELYEDITELNIQEVTKYFQRTAFHKDNEGKKLDDSLLPVPSEILGAVVRTDTNRLKQYETDGLKLISQGKVGVLLLAGGQGTRLGISYPKGMCDIGLPSRKTLYQLQAEKLLRLQILARDTTGLQGDIPWYIMTSEHTKEPTLQFFEDHSYFGLKEENLVVFEQGMLPTFTFDGQIILDKKHKISKAPDGNGGLYRALRDKGILKDLDARGIEYIHVYCVDNILVKIADPVFIGYCVTKGADCGAKVVQKAFPTEAVGVIGKVDGHYQVVEYSEITLKTAEKRNPDGNLTHNAGSICNHFFTTEFLRKVVNGLDNELMHHIAEKKIPFVDSEGQIVTPKRPNGIKLEKFVFDVFQFSKNFVVWEVLREDEFSPLKNADGAEKDTATTARESLYSLHYRQVVEAGGRFLDHQGVPLIPGKLNNGITEMDMNNNNLPDPIVVEISPLVAYAGEKLEDFVAKKEFPQSVYFLADGEKAPVKPNPTLQLPLKCITVKSRNIVEA